MRVATLLSWVLLWTCRAGEPDGSATPQQAVVERPSAGALGEAGAPSKPAEPVAIEPAPPPGVVLPLGVVLIEATDGGGRASYLWKATFVGDPLDARVQERMARARTEGEPLSATGAALELLADDVRAAGFEIATFGSMAGFDYPLRDAPVDVFVRVVTEADEPAIEILAGPRGG